MPTYRASIGQRSAATTSVVGNRPTGTTDNDGLLAFVIVRPDVDDTYGSVTAPAGWALLDSLAATSVARLKVLVYSKIASSEGATWTWTWSVGGGAGARAYVIVAAYSVANVTYLIDSGALQFNATVDLTCETPAITPTSQPGTLVSLYVHGEGITAGSFGAGVSLASGTKRIEVEDDTDGGYLRMALGDENYAALTTIPSRVSTADYGTKPSIGVSVLLRDSAYSPVTTQLFAVTIY